MPRFDPATVTELNRVGLLAELPGETLTKLAGRMVTATTISGSSAGATAMYHDCSGMIPRSAVPVLPAIGIGKPRNADGDDSADSVAKLS